MSNKIQNELRRVKEKLALFDQPGLNALLLDLIEIIDEDYNHDRSHSGAMRLIEILKRGYKKYVDENTEEPPKQEKLF